MPKQQYKYPLDGRITGDRYIIFSCKSYKIVGQDGEKASVNQRLITQICLPHPNELSEINIQQWGPTAQLGWSTPLKKAVEKLNLGGAVTMEVVKRTGKAINPSEILLYSGPELRSFSFSFELVPKNQKELNEIHDIIMCFKKFSLPEGSPTSATLGFPCVWGIDILGMNGKRDQTIDFGLKDRDFALTTYIPNYTPDGFFYAFKNGFPVKTVIRLDMTETAPLYRDDILWG